MEWRCRQLFCDKVVKRMNPIYGNIKRHPLFMRKEDTLLDKLELYYDYYKETCSLSKEAQSRRNRNYVILCVLEAILFLFSIKPETTLEILSTGVNAQFNAALVIGKGILQTLLWILIAYVMIRYCQDTLYIERQYVCIDGIEKTISKLMENSPFNREGEGYLKNYPMVLNFIDLFYKMFSPILFLIINTVHIFSEWKSVDVLTLALICDTAIFVEILIVTWFYFFEVHSKMTTWCKQNIPFIDKISKWLRKVLKEV